MRLVDAGLAITPGDISAFRERIDTMPTIYTSLRARHRRKILPPNPPLPKSEIFAAPPVGEEIRSDKVMDWPGEQWTKASYYFLRLGEVTYWGPFWKAGYAGWLHFAGEHTSFAFMKYMEGALSSVTD